ncbi:MAG: hypothetical protein WBP29_15230 [Candidatus Zixiibacteriota bacterium]
MHVDKDSVQPVNPSPAKKPSRRGITVGAIFVVVLLALLALTDPLMNWLVKPRIAEAFNQKHPAYALRIGDMHYSVFRNRFGFDNVAIDALDSSFTGTLGTAAVSGINWISLLWSRSVSSDNAGGLVVEIDSFVTVITNSQYTLRCGPLHISAPDSVIVIRDFEYRPIFDDEQLFAARDHRVTRYRIAVPLVEVKGFDGIDAIRRENYNARSAQFTDAFVEVLINKDKPASGVARIPLMPNELLALANTPLFIDSLNFRNSRLAYGERFAVGSTPAFLTFDSLHLIATGIANQAQSAPTIAIDAQALFMAQSPINVRISIPVADSNLNFQFSGSLGKLDACSFNPFVEKTERLRIKQGDLEQASFDIQVNDGRSAGYVRATYRDLSFAVIDKESGSEKGFLNSVASIISNSFMIRQDNAPEESGDMKVGVVDYTKKPNETFLRFAWLSLYSGVRDLVKK